MPEHGECGKINNCSKRRDLESAASDIYGAGDAGAIIELRQLTRDSCFGAFGRCSAYPTDLAIPKTGTLAIYQPNS